MSGPPLCDHPGASVPWAIRHPRHLQNKNAGPEKNPDFFRLDWQRKWSIPQKGNFLLTLIT